VLNYRAIVDQSTGAKNTQSACKIVIQPAE